MKVNIKKIFVEILPVMLSILALVVSFLSYSLSHKSYNEEYMDFDIANYTIRFDVCTNDKTFDVQDDCIILKSKAINKTQNIKNIKIFVDYNDATTFYLQGYDNIELPLYNEVYFTFNGIIEGLYTYPLEICLVNDNCTRNILQIRYDSAGDSFRGNIIGKRFIDSTNLYRDLYRFDEDYYMANEEVFGSYVTEDEFNSFFNTDY